MVAKPNIVAGAVGYGLRAIRRHSAGRHDHHLPNRTGMPRRFLRAPELLGQT